MENTDSNDSGSNVRDEDKKEPRYEIIAIIISIIALLVSCWGVSETNRVSKQVSEYEIKVAHDPKLFIWNQVINIDIHSKSDTKELVQLAYSNIGDGIAQNIKFRIHPDEQRKIALQCEDILASCLTSAQNQNTHADDFYHYLCSDVMDHSFNFIYDEWGNQIGELKRVIVRDDEFFSFDTTMVDTCAYLLPVTVENEKSYYDLPEDISILITNTLATAVYHQKSLENPISFDMSFSYQDIFDNLTEEIVTISFDIDGYGESYDRINVVQESDDSIELKLCMQVTVQQKNGN